MTTNHIDQLIDKAAAAIYASSVFGDEFAIDSAIDAWHATADGSLAKITTRMCALAALKAIAADIWDEGHAACDRDWAFTGDLSTPDEDRQPLTNPYRASETA